MTAFADLRSEIISYFLVLFPVDSQPDYLERITKRYLAGTYNDDFIERFWNDQAQFLRDDLIDETNRRIRKKASLRYEIMDDIGDRIRGAHYKLNPDPPNVFQDALQHLNPYEFEALAGVILKIAGCHSYWLTPRSHDQGLDAFGYASFLDIQLRWLGSKPEVVFLTQAKHYLKNRVSSNEIREFVGAAALAKFDIYAVQGEKYPELDMRPFAPVALIFVTSGEIKISTKTLARKSGMVVVASDELFQIFRDYWNSGGVMFPKTTKKLVDRLRKEIKGLPLAR